MPVSEATIDRVVTAYHEIGAPAAPAWRDAIKGAVGLSAFTVAAALTEARRRGFLDRKPCAPPPAFVEPPAAFVAPAPVVAAQPATVPAPCLPDRIAAALRSKPADVSRLSIVTRAAEADVSTAIMALMENGMRLVCAGGVWSVSREPLQEAYLAGPLHAFPTEPDGSFTFGACGDAHLGSKYERLDVLESLYDAFAEAGCKSVFNTGNWIDGEARFNVHDLHTRGLDAQVRYLASVYPKRPGITTYAVAGDDHEGWYAQREGVDIGRYAERAFRDAGREDWVNLGYMEAPVRIVHHDTGKDSIMSVVHPGGGSSYALSYAIQKIVESLDGGEKPAIGLYGHYHKLWSGNIRNVWCVQTGTTEDQTPFMRKKKLEAHVGGVICKARLDPATGAVVRFQAEILRYFNKGYYQNRWSHSGPVTRGDRIVAGMAA